MLLPAAATGHRPRKHDGRNNHDVDLRFLTSVVLKLILAGPSAVAQGANRSVRCGMHTTPDGVTTPATVVPNLQVTVAAELRAGRPYPAAGHAKLPAEPNTPGPAAVEPAGSWARWRWTQASRGPGVA